MRQLCFACFVNLQEKLGVINNELLTISTNLSYYSGHVNPNTVFSSNKKTKDIAERFNDYRRLHNVAESLSSLAYEYEKALRIAFINYNNSNLYSELVRFIAVKSYVSQKTEELVEQIGNLNHKLLLLRQNANPKYVPAPGYLKRYQNIYLQTFNSKYINNIILKAFFKSFDVEENTLGVILHWDHIASDSMSWQRIGREDNAGIRVFVKESYFGLELPIHYCYQTHELAHFFCFDLKNALKTIGKNANRFNMMCQNMRGALQDYLLTNMIISKHPEAEFLCDLFPLLIFQESYVVSLFLSLFGNDLARCIDIKATDVISGTEAIKGFLPSRDTYSWWVRLKVLCNIYKSEINDKKNSYWIEKIETALEEYHTSIENAFPDEFQRELASTIIFEKYYTKLATEQIKRLCKSKVVEIFKDQCKTIRQNDYDRLCSRPLQEIFNQHIEEFCNIHHIDFDNKCDHISYLHNIPLKHYTYLIPKLLKKLKCSHAGPSTLKYQNKLLRNLGAKPIPSGRFIRYIARIYFANNKGIYKVFTPGRLSRWNRQISYNRELLELGLCKYRVDCGVNDSNHESTSFNDIQNTLSSWQSNSLDNNELSKKSYLLFGSYNFALFTNSVSAKSLQKSAASKHSTWPPKFDHPYFMSIHSLIQVRSKKWANNVKEIVPGAIGVLMQIRIVEKDRRKMASVIESLAKYISNVTNTFNCDWSIYTSVGWEDLVIEIRNTSLKTIQTIENYVVSQKFCSRTLTHLLWDGIIDDSHELHRERLIDSAAVPTTSIRFHMRSHADSILDEIVNTLIHSDFRDCIYDLHALHGRYDMSIIWDSNYELRYFLKAQKKLLNTPGIIKYVSDFKTKMSWSLFRHNCTFWKNNDKLR
jgi:hypothetical protein